MTNVRETYVFDNFPKYRRIDDSDKELFKKNGFGPRSLDLNSKKLRKVERLINWKYDFSCFQGFPLEKVTLIISNKTKKSYLQQALSTIPSDVKTLSLAKEKDKNGYPVLDYDIRLTDNLANLRELEITYVKFKSDHCYMDNFTGLENLSDNLKSVIVYSNQLDSVFGLEPLINLKYLDINDSEIKDLEGIEKFKELRELDVSGNKLIDISHLNNPLLIKLDISNNQIPISDYLYVFERLDKNVIETISVSRNPLMKKGTDGFNWDSYYYDLDDFIKTVQTNESAHYNQKALEEEINNNKESVDHHIKIIEKLLERNVEIEKSLGKSRDYRDYQKDIRISY